MGGITDEQGRELRAELTFLTPDQNYVAEVYADGANADWGTNPLPIEISKYIVDSETVFILRLAPGGGMVIRFSPATAEEIENVPAYKP